MSAEDFDAVFYPGGHGPMEDLAGSDELGRLVLKMLDDDMEIVSVRLLEKKGGKSDFTADAPWTVIKSDCKKRARLNAMRYLLHRLPYARKDAASIGTIDTLLVGRASLASSRAD